MQSVVSKWLPWPSLVVTVACQRRYRTSIWAAVVGAPPAQSLDYISCLSSGNFKWRNKTSNVRPAGRHNSILSSIIEKNAADIKHVLRGWMSHKAETTLPTGVSLVKMNTTICSKSTEGKASIPPAKPVERYEIKMRASLSLLLLAFLSLVAYAVYLTNYAGFSTADAVSLTAYATNTCQFRCYFLLIKIHFLLSK